jgi:hypothetical protein
LRWALSESAAVCALVIADAPGTPEAPKTLSFCRWVMVSRSLPAGFDEHAAASTSTQRAIPDFI